MKGCSVFSPRVAMMVHVLTNACTWQKGHRKAASGMAAKKAKRRDLDEEMDIENEEPAFDDDDEADDDDDDDVDEEEEDQPGPAARSLPSRHHELPP